MTILIKQGFFFEEIQEEMRNKLGEKEKMSLYK